MSEAPSPVPAEPASPLQKLTDFVEKEAATEGPAAQADLQQNRDHYQQVREAATPAPKIEYNHGPPARRYIPSHQLYGCPFQERGRVRLKGLTHRTTQRAADLLNVDTIYRSLEICTDDPKFDPARVDLWIVDDIPMKSDTSAEERDAWMYRYGWLSAVDFEPVT